MYCSPAVWCAAKDSMPQLESSSGASVPRVRVAVEMSNHLYAEAVNNLGFCLQFSSCCARLKELYSRKHGGATGIGAMQLLIAR